MAQQGFGQRVRRAWHRWASQRSEAVTYADFGAAIAKAEDPPREVPYVTSSISEWISERSEPKARTYRAIAALTGFREGWLIKGEMPEIGSDEGEQGARSAPPPPPQIPVTSTDFNQFVTQRIPVEGEPRKATKTRRPGKGRSAMAS